MPSHSQEKAGFSLCSVCGTRFFCASDSRHVLCLKLSHAATQVSAHGRLVSQANSECHRKLAEKLVLGVQPSPALRSKAPIGVRLSPGPLSARARWATLPHFLMPCCTTPMRHSTRRLSLQTAEVREQLRGIPHRSPSHVLTKWRFLTILLSEASANMPMHCITLLRRSVVRRYAKASCFLKPHECCSLKIGRVWTLSITNSCVVLSNAE